MNPPADSGCHSAPPAAPFVGLATVPGGRFPRSARLDEYGVKALLKSGRRINSVPPGIGVRFDRPPQVAPRAPARKVAARLAISVPKRLLKRAVDRNYVKRVVREQFRQHSLARLPVDLLVSLQSKVPLEGSATPLVGMVARALDAVVQKVQAGRVVQKPQASTVA